MSSVAKSEVLSERTSSALMLQIQCIKSVFDRRYEWWLKIGGLQMASDFEFRILQRFKGLGY